jgi:hypothetical protein
VCNKSHLNTSGTTASTQGWFVRLGTGTKYGNSTPGAAYTSAFKQNEIVTVCIDFSSGTAGTLRFSKNGVDLGVAFDNVPGPVYPAVILRDKIAQITLLS